MNRIEQMKRRIAKRMDNQKKEERRKLQIEINLVDSITLDWLELSAILKHKLLKII